MDNPVFVEIESEPIDCQIRTQNKQLALAWTDLSFKVGWFNEKIILNQLTGQVKFGEVTGLMGPSGCGKTTLLKCLSGLNQSGLAPNSRLFVSKTQPIKQSFITQDHGEHLMMNLTVKESLIYASMLKNSHLDNVNHEKNIQQIANELVLTKCLDTRVKYCSGGEQKRLAIAMELTAKEKPNLMCFDEPTTGLDSDAAERLMLQLNKLATRHRIAVVVSIHQPNQDIINLIDHLYVLSMAGFCIYDGTADNLRQHLIDCQVAERELKVPIQCLLKLATKVQHHSDQSIGMATETRRLIKATRNQQQTMNQAIRKQGKLLTSKIDMVSKKYKLISFKETYYLLCRNWKNFVLREWKYEMFEALGLLIGVAIFVVLFPNDIGQDPACPPDLINQFNLTEITTKLFNQVNGVRENAELNVGFLNKMFLYAIFLIMFSYSYKLTKEIKLFLSERNNNWYSTGSFYLTFNLMHLPVVVILNYLYFWFNYYGTSQLGMTKFWQGVWDLPEPFQTGLIFQIIFIISFQGIAMNNAIIFNHNPAFSLIASLAFIVVYYLYCDFMIPIHELGTFQQTMSLFSMFNLIFRSLLIILYGGERCAGDESSILTFYRIEEDKLWFNFKLIVWQGLLWRIVMLLILLWKSNKVWLNQFKLIILNKKSKDEINFENKIIKYVNKIENQFDNQTQTLSLENMNNNKTEVSPALAWKNLSVEIDGRLIIDNISGIINFKEIVGLMGPSGAGKTTLLKSIDGQTKKTYLNDDLKFFVNKNQRVRKCFISQNQKEHLMISLTVSESLLYSSRLKNSNEKNFPHKNNVKKIAKELLLTACLKNVISNCSGGEQKRLSIAQELTAKEKPNLMCIDEPTSGLDSCSAELTVACLRRLVLNNQMAVVASIHQPNDDVLNLFDKIYVMSASGKCIFYESPNKIIDHLKFFNLPIKQLHLPIEILMKIASTKNFKKSNFEITQRNKIINIQVVNNMSAVVGKQLETEVNLNKNYLKSENVFSQKNYYRKRFNLIDFWILAKRHFKKQLIREWKYQLAFLSVLFAAAGIILVNFPSDLGIEPGCYQKSINLTDFGSINQQILDAITGYEQRYSQNIKFLWILLVVVIALFLLGYAYVFINEIKVVFNEIKNGWYTLSSYFWSRTAVEMILVLPVIYLFSLLLYINTSQPELNFWFQAFWLNVPQRFINFFLVVFLDTFNSIGFGILTSSLFPQTYFMTVFSFITFAHFWFFLSGFLVPFSRLNFILKLIAYPSHIRMAMESLIIILYGHRCPDVSIALNVFEITENGLWLNIVLMAIVGLFYWVSAFLILSFKFISVY